MGRKSTIKDLDPRIREAVDKAIREDRATIDEIVTLIEAMGGDASRSAVGRYVKNAKDQMERYREAQQIAKTWVGDLQEDPDSDVGRLLTEMLRTVAFQQIGNMGDKDSVKPADIMFIGKAIKELASADKISVERAAKIRAQVVKEAAEVVEETAKAQGMDQDQVKFWREKVLGIR